MLLVCNKHGTTLAHLILINFIIRPE